MDNLQWRRSGHDHGVVQAQESGYTAVYLHYKTGLSVSTSGRILAQLMELRRAAGPIEHVAKRRHFRLQDGTCRQAINGRPLTCAPVGLPEPTRCYAVAGSLGSKTGKPTAKVSGDGLVPVCSALGQHADRSRQLAFPTDHQAVFFNTGHMDLLSSIEVCSRLRLWLN